MKIGTVQTQTISCTTYSGPVIGDATYIYNQELAASVWTIAHNLNKYVSVSIVDTGKNEIEGDVQYIDHNNVRVTFSSPFSGLAYCN